MMNYGEEMLQQPPDKIELSSNRLSDISQNQVERLSHIDFRVNYTGVIGRNELVNRFGIKEAAATRDIALYRELAPNNLEYNTKLKIYERAKSFKAIFNYSKDQIQSALKYGFGDDFIGSTQSLVPFESPAQLNSPELVTLSVLTRAIYGLKAVAVNYCSLSSGTTSRTIVPFTLVDNGLRWHVRAYDRKKLRFSDFVINRISKPSILSTDVPETHEQREADIQWNRIVELEIVPHPKLNHPHVIEKDYGMEQGVLKTNVRAALAGYVLRRWNVDCTSGGDLEGPEFHLWLGNREALYGVENLVIAPGYRDSGKE